MTNPIFNGVVSAFSGGMVTSWTAFVRSMLFLLPDLFKWGKI